MVFFRRNYTKLKVFTILRVKRFGATAEDRTNMAAIGGVIRARAISALCAGVAINMAEIVL